MDSSTTKLNDTHLENKDVEDDLSFCRYTSNSTWSRMRILWIHHTGDVCLRVVLGALGLLCVLLLAVVPVLSMERSQLSSTLSNCSSERDLLQTRLETLQEKNTNHKTFLQEGWRVFGSSYYYISTEKKSWDKAREDCQKRGANLVIINNRDEQEFLSNLNKEFWIGLTDKEGKWKWIDGTALNKRFWDNGQPNSYGGDEDCAEIRPRGYLTNWNDDLCSRPQLWLCEKQNQ